MTTEPNAILVTLGSTRSPIVEGAMEFSKNLQKGSILAQFRPLKFDSDREIR